MSAGRSRALPPGTRRFAPTLPLARGEVMRIQCLQPLITLRGASSVTTIVQPESGWLDLGMFRDIVAWLDVREVTSTGGGSVVLNYQSSPTKEDPATGSLFATMASVTISSAAGVTVTPMLADVITNPLARWLRWQLVATSQTAMWDATFRICIAGGRSPRWTRDHPTAPSGTSGRRRSPSSPPTSWCALPTPRG